MARLAPGLLLRAAGAPPSVQRDLSAQRRKELLDGFLPASARHAGLTVDIRNAILGWPRARLARPLPGDPPLRALAPCLLIAGAFGQRQSLAF